MRLFRTVILPVLLCLLLLDFACSAASGSEKEKREARFRWAFGAVRAAENGSQVEPVGREMVLHSGDKVKMMIELRRKCFVYLIHSNAQGEVTMLFPYSVKQFDTDYLVSQKYYVPKGDAWFQFDNKIGRETFYLIASDQRLLDVEFLYEKYVSAEPPGKVDLAGQVLAEIEGIRKQYLASSGQAEILARNENLERGFERATGADPTDIANLANEVAFNNLYSETFVIEHR